MSGPWTEEGAACLSDVNTDVTDDSSITTGYCTGEQSFCALSLKDEETRVKSAATPEPLITPCEPFSGHLDNNSELLAAVRMTSRQPMSAIGAVTERNTQPIPLADDRSQDITLNSQVPFANANRHNPQQGQTAGAISGSGRFNRPNVSSEASAVPIPQPAMPEASRNDVVQQQDLVVQSSHVYAHQVAGASINQENPPCPLAQGNNMMNIPPSLSSRLNINQAPAAMAEQQLSFRTINHSIGTGPSALPGNAQDMISTTTVPQGSVQYVTPAIQGAGPFSQMNQFDSAQTGYTNASIPVSASQNSNTSAPRSSARSSLREPLTDSMLIRQLPTSILEFLALRLESPSCTNYWHLLELHGWNYSDTLDFSHKKHEISPFHSVLKCEGFETYSLSDLKLDLEELPRKDILYDLSKRIEKYNSDLPPPTNM